MVEERYTLIKNLRLIDAEAKRTDGCDLLFAVKNRKSKILEIGKNLRAPEGDGAQVVNVHGRTACPAFTDLRCSIPDPGYPHKETLATGLSAAVAGGYARVLLSPTSKPLPDNRAAVRAAAENGRRMSDCRAETAVPLTVGGKGEVLCDFEGLFAAGAVAVSACGEEREPDAEKLSKAMEACKKTGMLFIAPIGEKSTEKKGSVNKGRLSKALNDEGISGVGELLALSKAILLSKYLEAPIHFPLVTLAESVAMVAEAKKEGIKISCGTAPPYFSFSEEELLLSGNNAKLLPPLREEKDRLAVIGGLANGTIDCICTDHTPCSESEKRGDRKKAAFGAVGLETAFGAGITHLVLPGHLSLYKLIELMSLAPAHILNKDASLKVGGACDLAFIDTFAELVYGKNTMRSRNSNTPFFGRALRGRVTGLYIDGIRQF